MLRRWTKAEDRLLLRHWPDLSLLEKRLVGRTAEAIRGRRRTLGLISPPVPLMSQEELRVLNHLWSTKASREELVAKFPRLTWLQIQGAAKHNLMGARYVVHTGENPQRSKITAFARARGVSNKELDRLVGSAGYFYRGCPTPYHHLLLAAAKAVGMRVTIRWDPLD